MSATTRARRTTRAALAISTGISVAAATLAVAVPAHAAPVTLRILAFNDFHGRILPDGTGSGDAGVQSTVEWATTIETLRAATPGGEGNALLIGAGDSIGASLFASAYADDEPSIEVLNALDVTSSATGNHEFDKGYPFLRDTVINGTNPNYTPAEFPILGANVRDRNTDAPALAESQRLDVNGVAVCIVGAVTQETPTLVSPAGVSTLTFKNPVTEVNRVVAALEAASPCELTIASYHEGAPNGAQTLEQNIAASPVFASIVNDTDASVDVIINGHTHQRYAYTAPRPGGGTRSIVQTGQYAAAVGQVDITVDDTTGAVTANTPTTVSTGTTENLALPRVAAVDTITRNALAAADVPGNVAVGKITRDITTAYTGGSYGPSGYTGGTRDDRANESTLGDLVADALKDTRVETFPAADIGVVNPGGLRDELLYAANLATSPQNGDGVVTFEEANAVLPFANDINLVTLTGASLKRVLEQQWQRDAAGNVPSRPFLQLGLSSNVRVTLDPARPEGDRVTSILVDEVPIDVSRTYRVATFSFLAAGGDNFRAFTEGTRVETGRVDRDLWVEGFLKNGVTKAPSFSRQQVYTTMPGAVAANQNVAFALNRLDLTSQGSPANSSVRVFASTPAATSEVAGAPVSGGTANVSFNSGSRSGSLVAVAYPTETVIGHLQSKWTSEVSGKTKPIRYGDKATVDVTVAAPTTPAGTVVLKAKSGKQLGRATLVGGKATIDLAAKTLRPGKRDLTLSYSGDATHKAANSTVTLKVKKVAPSLRVKTKPRRIVADRTNARVKIKLTAPVVSQVRGKVKVKAGGETYRAKLKNGKVTIRLDEFGKPGRKRITVKYLGNAFVKATKEKLRVKVRRS